MKVFTFLIIISSFISNLSFSQTSNGFSDHQVIGNELVKAIKSENDNDLTGFILKTQLNVEDYKYLTARSQFYKVFPYAPRKINFESDFQNVKDYSKKAFRSFRKQLVESNTLESLKFGVNEKDTVIYDKLKDCYITQIRLILRTEYKEYKIRIGDFYKINGSWKTINEAMYMDEKYIKTPPKTKKEILDSTRNEFLKSVKWFQKPSLTSQYTFSSGLYPYRKVDKYGYIDSLGNVIIPYKFDFAYNFVNNRALVSENGKVFYFIDKTQKQTSDTFSLKNIPYPYFNHYSKGIFTVESQLHDYKKYYFVDIITGKRINDSYYESCYPKPLNNYIHVQLKDKWGLIDFNGNQIIPNSYDRIDIGFNNINFIPVQRRSAFGYIDIEDKLKLKFIYEYAGNFVDNLASVKINGLIGYIDTLGNNKIPFIYDEGGEFKNGKAIVTKNKKYGVIDKKGTLLTLGEWDKIESDNGYLYFAKKNNEKYILNFEKKIFQKVDYEKNLGPDIYENGYSIVVGEDGINIVDIIGKKIFPVGLNYESIVFPIYLSQKIDYVLLKNPVNGEFGKVKIKDLEAKY